MGTTLGGTVKVSRKPKRTRAEISAIRRAAGRKGGLQKAGRVSIATLQKDLIKEHIDQRMMRATDVALDSQIAIARGLSFLYRIDKKWIPTGKDRGYWRNEKPVLVESRTEIEEYLERIAENNGDIEDDEDSGAAYYYITTKEPNNQAIDSMLNRVHGKPKETVDVNQHHTFSLLDLHKKREMIDGNADTRIVEELPLLAP